MKVRNKHGSRLSVPGAGRSLGREAELRAAPLRLVADLLDEYQSEIHSDFEAVFAPRVNIGRLSNGQFASQASWALVSMHAIAQLINTNIEALSLQEAERWFLGSHASTLPSLVENFSPQQLAHVDSILSTVDYDDDFNELLPYILEPNGLATRLTEMKDASTGKARAAKRSDGIFYTPSDVAEYIVDVVAKNSDLGRWIDPACGSGVFLLSVLRQFDSLDNRAKFCVENLYGVDICPIAVNAAVFVLLAELFRAGDIEYEPWSLWHLLRLNFVVADTVSMSFDRCAERGLRNHEKRKEVRQSLLSGGNPGVTHLDSASASTNGQLTLWSDDAPNRRFLFDLLPEADAGFDFVIGNPPYSKLENRAADFPWLEEEFASCEKPSESTQLYPLFVELFWKLTAENAGCGMVLPLSIGFSQNRQFTELRRSLQERYGTWNFSFFDREPHGLFGEEVKTRNSIVTWRRSVRGEFADRSVNTTSLMKWTSKTRETLFESLQYASLGSTNILGGIPKIGTSLESELLRKIRASPSNLLEPKRIQKCFSEDAFSACAKSIHIAPTAYNFLSVFRRHEIDKDFEGEITQNKVFQIQAESTEQASYLCAVLTSQLVYWLWHVSCDGFHVSSWFLKQLPFAWGCLAESDRAELVCLGDSIWKEIAHDPTISKNGGRLTIAYDPTPIESLRSRCDSILLTYLGVTHHQETVEYLSRFVRSNIIVDETDSRRVKQHKLKLETTEV